MQWTVKAVKARNGKPVSEAVYFIFNVALTIAARIARQAGAALRVTVETPAGVVAQFA